MSYPEILGRVVGMLTVAHEQRHGQGRSDEEFVDLYTSLLSDLGGTERLTLALRSDDPESVQAAVQGLIEQVVSEAGMRFATFAGAFIYAFEELATEYEAACPDADVLGLLNRIGLQAAEVDG